MQRRSFLKISAGSIATSLAGAQEIKQSKGIFVAADRDRFDHPHDMGITINNFKVSGNDTNEGLFALEQTFHAKGGPPRHLHPHQDEWFFVIEGTFRFEIGEDSRILQPGDSVLAPRNLPHVWAFAGGGTGKMLVSFTPAGKMEAFFNHIAADHSMPPQTPQLWSAYDMQLLGPPLKV
jgi:quercetin dioxygenase-like cupin family protein